MSIQDLINYRIEKAKNTIIEAEKMAEIEHWNACVNRLYYACFYAVNALLIKYNFSSSKHSGVRGLLNKHFIKNGVIDKDFCKLYNSLFIFRQQSDYEDFFEMDKSETQPKISKTKEFITEIEKLLSKEK
mgnify:FL=1